ncbi:MAG: hypothetical protein PUD49_00045, partial [Collinsella sp.]|nr:hypothetical protein [Collinsella sp.]
QTGPQENRFPRVANLARGFFRCPGRQSANHLRYQLGQLKKPRPKLATLRFKMTCPLRNGPIYYIKPITLNHAKFSEIKTAGRRLVDFVKTQVCSDHTGQT